MTYLELIQVKDNTARAIAGAHSVILTGNQLEDLADNLLQHLKNTAVYTLCR